MSIKSQIEKINCAVYHNPNLISTLFKDTSIKKGLLYSRLRRLVPHRIGIEFECCGELMQNIINELDVTFKNKNQLLQYFGIYDYSQDTYYCLHPIKQANGVKIKFFGDIDKLEEFRISIKDFSQLKGLYNLLQYADKYCEIPIGGGIHIHVDFTRFYDCNDIRKNRILSYLNNHLDDIGSIFPKYDGTYNSKVAKWGSKSCWLNVSYNHSFEFRIAPLTFDYEQLIPWIIDCSAFVSEVIRRCHLNSKKLDKHLEREVESVESIHINQAIANEINNYLEVSQAYNDYTDARLNLWSANEMVWSHDGRYYTVRIDAGTSSDSSGIYVSH